MHSREQLLEECSQWKKDIRELWKCLREGHWLAECQVDDNSTVV